MYYYKKFHKLSDSKSFEQAVKYFQMSANQGNGYASSNLGICYYNTKQNYQLAISYLKQGIKSNVINYVHIIGKCYLTGRGVKKNYRVAASCYHLAASKQIGRKSLLKLGECNQYGLGVHKNFSKAFICYKQLYKNLYWESR